MKIVVQVTISLVFFVCSYLIPKQRGLYLFGSLNGKSFSGNSKALFLYLLQHSDKDVYYVSHSQSLITSMTKLGLGEHVIYSRSRQGFWYFLRAEYIFTDANTADAGPGISSQLGRFRTVNLRHGDSMKKIACDTDIPWTWKLLTKRYSSWVVQFMTVGSPFAQTHLNSAFRTNKSVITGLARYDVFTRDDLEIYDVSHLLELDQYDKIILYAPTWRDDSTSISPFSSDFLENLDLYLQDHNILLLSKAHYFSHSFVNDTDNIRDISQLEIDIQEILKYTDLLITDYSSIYIDYILLDRPVIFYAYDLDNYLAHRDLYINYSKAIMPSMMTTSADDLLMLLQQILSGSYPATYHQEYKSIKDFWHTRDGSAINNILDKLGTISS